MPEAEGDAVGAFTQMGKTIDIVEWIIITILMMYLVGKTLPDAWNNLNTDFPNYYLTSRLAHEKFDTTRVYEWFWIQREKDHRDIDQRVVGMIPITPFSTLAVRPLASLSPLMAKRYWLIINLCLLAWVAALLRSMTQMAWRRITLVIALSSPLHRNLLYGQYYVLLLFVLALACWFYLRTQRFTAGMLVGVGFGLKIFPILYLLYFLRKRVYWAIGGGLAGCAAVAVASIGAFGWELNRIYVLQVLPWALRGEGLDPYNGTTSSFAVLLHRLFIYEPQWNPHPVWHAPWLFALLHPLLQLLIIAPVLLLTSPGPTGVRQMRLEWASMLLAILTISTMPASYVFTLLILPICFLWEELQTWWPLLAGMVLALYFAAGFPAWKNPQGFGWHVLLGFPRLYALIGLCAIGSYLLWWRVRSIRWFRRDGWLWSGALGCGLLAAIVAGLHHQRGLYTEYSARLAMPSDALIAARPTVTNGTVSFVGMLRNGYQAGVWAGGAPSFSGNKGDQLSVTASGDERWVEEAGRQSNIISEKTRYIEIAQAQAPVISTDGSRMAFLRGDHGRMQLWVHEMKGEGVEDRPLTPVGINVLEMTFLGKDVLAFAADVNERGPQLYTVDMAANVLVLLPVQARYPAGSPDGKWLAYSRLERGNWNLWIRESESGQARRITDAECNHIEPAWDGDSKTLVYANDCGRALWFTALSRRRALP